MKIIKLKVDTEMSTGYRGRGLPSREITLPAGTAVRYNRLALNDGVTVVHTVTYTADDGLIYSSNLRETLKEENDRIDALYAVADRKFGL